MLIPPADAPPPREHRGGPEAVEEILERQGFAIFGHSRPYRRLVVTHRPDLAQPRDDTALTEFLTVPLMRHGRRGSRFSWNGEALDGLARFAPDRGEYYEDVNATAYAVGDRSLDMADIVQRMQACSEQGGVARLVWAGARPGGGVELHLGTDRMDTVPPGAPDSAVPVGAMLLSSGRLEHAAFRHAGAPDIIGFDVMQAELDAFCAHAHKSTHTVQLQSLDPAALLAGGHVVWTTDTEVPAFDAASACAAAAHMFHDVDNASGPPDSWLDAADRAVAEYRAANPPDPRKPAPS